jgi:uncharacterized protein
LIVTVKTQELKLDIARIGTVSSMLTRPEHARACYVLAHGAGADMRHSFMNEVAEGLAERGIAAFRFNFPYMERKQGRPDQPAVAHATIRAAVEEAARLCPQLKLIAGGKSFGGRMTSQAQAIDALPGVRGLAFLAFPLHPVGKPSSDRARHLADVDIPMLFLQGTRDALAELKLLRPVVQQLGKRATLHTIEHADHAFHVPVRSGRTDGDVLDELAATSTDWMRAR